MNSILHSILLFSSSVLLSAGAADLEAGFKAPTREAKPHTWYHMMNGNVTKAGITRDFEELAKVGIGGVQMFDAGCDIPAGEMKFNSPEWFDMFKHAASEARRLGLEICIPNCSGWSSSGGPWNPPSNGMKRVTFSLTKVTGPKKVALKLPREKNDNGFYADVGVFAFPTPKAEKATFPDVKTTVSDDGQAVLFASDRPFSMTGFSFALAYRWTSRGDAEIAVELSDDGVTFRPLETFGTMLGRSGTVYQGERFHAFPQTLSARAVRARIVKSFVASKFVKPRPEAIMKISDLAAKMFEFRQETKPFVLPTTSDQVVARGEVRDVTANMAADGTFTWDAPAGDWTILRVGYRCTGKKNHPASKFGVGLEVDKLSAEALDYHFEQYVGRLCRELGSLAGAVETGFNNILVDSYEVGSQNWTQKMESEFLRRRGYSIRPFLPAFAGYVIDDVATTERFLEDFRRVVADLFAENYAGALAKKCHQYGLRLSLEPYGNCPADNLQYGEYADIPMGEFWCQGSPYIDYCRNEKFVSSVAHVWGKRFVGTESFTSNPGKRTGRWQTTPFTIKAQGDGAYAGGVNRIIYHRFTHQPWADDRYLPGMTMGRWGMHLDRTQTWWDFSSPWFAYQARCQFMLQQGTFCADVLFFAGEQAPNQGGNTNGSNLDSDDAFYALPDGYASDTCPTDAMYRLKVDGEGRVVVPGGFRYRVLAVPSVEAMSPEMVTAIAKLREAGATVVWQKRPVRAPGLKWGRDGDAKVRALADALWTKGVLECSPAEALAKLGVAPDVVVEKNAAKAHVKWIHRRDANADWYFVAAPNKEEATVTLSFRQTGRVPELWDAETATCAPAEVWYEKNGRTFVDIPLTICGSKFVVFRKTVAADAVPRTAPPAHAAAKPVVVPVEGAWTVKFPQGYLPNKLAAVQEAETVTFDRLASWHESANLGVRYFSGTATYLKTVPAETVAKARRAGGRVEIDLGDVKHFAEVTANGKLLATLWKPPFRVDVTDVLKDGEPLDLKIRVTNLWANRLIGDDIQHADDCEWVGNMAAEDGLDEPGIKAIPQWVKEGKKSPTGRCTFTTWKHWTKNDELLPSGLLGPVSLRVFAGKAKANGVEEVNVREGVGNFLRKIREGKKEIVVAYLGGSITAMTGWRDLTTDWLKKTYPGVTFKEIHASIGGTGSDLGVFRVGRDALRHSPDLLFVEFATNDSGYSPESIYRSMEGIVRQTWAKDPTTDLVFAYTVTHVSVTNYVAGAWQRSAAAMEKVADHYGIPSVCFGPRVAEEVKAGRLVMKMADAEAATAVPTETPNRDKAIADALAKQGKTLFARDGVHPAMPGHRLYLAAVTNAFAQMQSLPPADHAAKMATPFVKDNLEQAKMVPVSSEMLSGSWRKLAADDEKSKKFSSRMGEIWEGATPGDKLSFKFRGTRCAIYDLLGPDGGQVWITVDGKRRSKPVALFDSYCTYHRIAQLDVFAGKDGEHSVEIEIDKDQPSRQPVAFRLKDSAQELAAPKYNGTKFWPAQIMLVGDLVK